MGEQWRDDVCKLLDDLEAAQLLLSSLYERKRTALVRGRSDELLDIAREESSLTDRLHAVLEQRGRILDKARQAGLQQTDSLSALAQSLQPADRQELESRIAAARKRTDWLRRETWVQWIITHRACSHYSGLLELIANSGKTSPTYDAIPDRQTSGGAIFDASI